MVAPMRFRTLPMTWTSEMLGTFSSVVAPGASRVAAMSLSAEFLAPETATVPLMRWPPSTRMISKRFPFKKHARGHAPGMMSIAVRANGAFASAY